MVPRDPERPADLVDRGVAGDGVFVSELVLLETEWVLRSRYKLKKAELLDTFSALLDEFRSEASVDVSMLAVAVQELRRLGRASGPSVQ